MKTSEIRPTGNTGFVLDFRSFSSRFVLSVNGNDFKMLLVRFVLDREVPKEIFRLIPNPKPISLNV